MKDDIYSRTYGIYGDDIDKIIGAHVAVVGLGGVGGECAIALVRCGVGQITIIDGDLVCESNLNRQAISFRDNVGQSKALACEKLLKNINPDVIIHAINSFWEKDSDIDLSSVDYIADAIDSVGKKADLIEFAHNNNIPIISAMGAGNKVDPTSFKIADISKTKVDPLARAMRRLLKERSIVHTDVVYSEEEPRIPFVRLDEKQQGLYSKRNAPASCSFVPSTVGLIMAGHIINHLVK